MIEYHQYNTLPDEYIDRKIAEYLAEDCPAGDATTDPIFMGYEEVCARAEAEEDLVFAGAPILKHFFAVDKISEQAADGQRIPKGGIIARFSGSAKDILTKERVFLNLIQRLCGIATLTSKYAEIAAPWGVRILDTRKTTPGLRLFEKYAVTCGGGFNHRLDLSSGILIKDNHINAAGSITGAVAKSRAANSGLKIEVEVENFDQLREAIDCGADGFLLDNMPVETTVEAVRIVRSSPRGQELFIESSGGITLETLSGYVRTGVNAISVGALTHSARAANIHLEF